MEKKTWETPQIKAEDFTSTKSASVPHSAEHNNYYITSSVPLT